MIVCVGCDDWFWWIVCICWKIFSWWDIIIGVVIVGYLYWLNVVWGCVVDDDEVVVVCLNCWYCCLFIGGLGCIGVIVDWSGVGLDDCCVFWCFDSFWWGVIG